MGRLSIITMPLLDRCTVNADHYRCTTNSLYFSMPEPWCQCHQIRGFHGPNCTKLTQVHTLLQQAIIPINRVHLHQLYSPDFSLCDWFLSPYFRGHMYEQQISPLIKFIFYPPFKLKKSACMKCIYDYPVCLNVFKVIHSHFYI